MLKAKNDPDAENQKKTQTHRKEVKVKDETSTSVHAPLKERNGLAVNVNGSGSAALATNKGKKTCIAEVVVWKGKANSHITPQQAKKPEKPPGQLFVVSYPDVEIPLSQRQRAPPKTKTILKEKPIKIQREPREKVPGSGQRRIPRTTKQPKTIQFISLEQHRQMLEEYIRNASSKTQNANANNINKDFRVDSLFKQEQHQQQESQAPVHTDVKSFEIVPTPLTTQNCVSSDANGNPCRPQQTSTESKERSPVDESRHSHMDDSGVSQHSFTVDDGDFFVDDVARYELVESTEISSVDFEAFAALGTISGPSGNSGRKPPKIPRMTNQRRNSGKSISATTTTEDASGVKTIEIIVDDCGKPRCTYTELIEKALTEAGDLTVSEIYQWISKKYPFFRPEDDRWKNSVRHNLSINPYFKKGEKSRGGAGHLWTISEESKGIRPNYRRKSCDNLCELEISMPMESDTDRAVASILGQYNLARANQLQQEQHNGFTIETPNDNPPPPPEEPQPQPQPQPQPPQEPEPPIIMPDEIVIGYESLPPGTYTLELNGLSLQTENIFDLETINQAGYVIVGEDDSNKENLSSISNIMNEVAALQNYPFMNEACVNGSVASSQLNFENFGEGSMETKRDGFNYPRDMNNRTEFFSMPEPPICQEVLEEKQPLTPDSSHELLLLDNIGPNYPMSLDCVMSEDNLPIMNEPLFDAKELGMMYPYEEDVPREGTPENEV